MFIATFLIIAKKKRKEKKNIPPKETKLEATNFLNKVKLLAFFFYKKRLDGR